MRCPIVPWCPALEAVRITVDPETSYASRQMPRTALDREALPGFFVPMLLRPGLPSNGERDRWALELKWDGMRAQLRIAGDGAWCLRSRPGRVCSDQFPELARLAEVLDGRPVVLDGELVCLDADGRPDFQRLRRRLSATNAQAATSLAMTHAATFVVFDVLHLAGRAVRHLPYAERRTCSHARYPEPARPGERRIHCTGISTPYLM